MVSQGLVWVTVESRGRRAGRRGDEDAGLGRTLEERIRVRSTSVGSRREIEKFKYVGAVGDGVVDGGDDVAVRQAGGGAWTSWAQRTLYAAGEAARRHAGWCRT